MPPKKGFQAKDPFSFYECPPMPLFRPIQLARLMKKCSLFISSCL